MSRQLSLGSLVVGRPLLSRAFARHGATLKNGGDKQSYSDAVGIAHRVALLLGCSMEEAVNLLRNWV